MFKYPWGNLQGLNLAWFLEKFNQLLEDWATAEAGIDGALDDEIQKAEDALSDVFDARDAAAASATAAAGSASSAGTSATAAQNSATAAASSATLANNKATAAGLSEANAAQSASQAALSATNAGNSATQAGNSATAAGNSASAAAASETAAGNSASAAAISETNAAASAAAAEAVEESIPDDYTTLSNKVNNNPLFYIYPSIYLPANRIIEGPGHGNTSVFNHNIITISGTVERRRIIDILRTATDPNHTIFLPAGIYRTSIVVLEKNIAEADEEATVYIDFGFHSLDGTFTRLIGLQGVPAGNLAINSPYISSLLSPLAEGKYDMSFYSSIVTFTNSSFTISISLEKV